MKSTLKDLAESWVATDTDGVRKDVARLGSVRAAAEYSSEMSIGQPDWEELATEEGVKALEAAIADIL